MDGEGKTYFLTEKYISFMISTKDFEETLKAEIKEAIGKPAGWEFCGIKFHTSNVVPAGWVLLVDKDGNIVGRMKI